MVKPKLTTDFSEAVVREGADELTPRAEEEGALRIFIDTKDLGDSVKFAVAAHGLVMGNLSLCRCRREGALSVWRSLLAPAVPVSTQREGASGSSVGPLGEPRGGARGGESRTTPRSASPSAS